MKSLFVIIGLTIGVQCTAQIYDPSRFKHISLPEQTSQFKQAVTNPPATDFAVSIDTEGALKISLPQSVRVKKYTYNSGILLALAFGEIGGDLFYQPFDETIDKVIVNGQTVKKDGKLGDFHFLLKNGDPALAWLEGNAFTLFDGANIRGLTQDSLGWVFFVNDGQMDNGALYRLTAKNNTFNISKLLQFDHTAPTAICLRKNRIYLATTRDFYVIDATLGKVELQLDNIFLNGSYPNSISVLSKNEIYVGMRSSYAKITPQAKQVDTYLYQY